jgi:hypothetical protein
MPLHAVFVTEETLDFIQQVNGGVRPANECLETRTVLVHADRCDDTDPNQLMSMDDFNKNYRWHECSDDNCNIVEKL